MKHISTTLPTMIGRACTKAVFLDAFSSKNAMGRYGLNYSLSFDCGNKERFTFTRKGPRKGWRTPLNTIICSEQRDAETRLSYFGARYYDSDLLTGWLTVDPMSDKYPSMSSYSYCASNPLKLVDPDGNDWYQMGANYYWSDKVVNRNTTPRGCRYIGNDNSLYRHFGLSFSSCSHETSQIEQTLVGTNAESSNPYEPKYYAFGIVTASARSTIGYSIQKDEKTGRLIELTINVDLETIVTDNNAGGYASALLEVSYGDVNCRVPFKENKETAYVPRDICTYRYFNTSLTVSDSKLSENCFSKLQIKGSWFSNGRPMTIPFTLGVIPGSFKHIYK